MVPSIPEDKLLVYFYRNASYAGGGRTHNLTIDKRPIGQLTGDNYYRFLMWPGEYHFSVVLPREEFFGQVSPPVTVSRQIKLMRHPEGNIYICEYTDGMGSSGFAFQRVVDAPALIKERTLAQSFKARDTAHVTHYYKVRYDGPAYNGQPHGQGTLTWPDDSIFKGIFEHGHPTRQSKFFFPNGLIYMGPNYRGRPIGPGLLMTAQGRILFAGPFENEKPSGRGIRHGANGPEFCLYDKGQDITETFRQLAQKELDVKDEQLIRSYRDPEAVIDTKIRIQKERLSKLAALHDPDKLQQEYANSRKEIERLEKNKKRLILKMEAERDAFIAQLRASRYEREIAREKEIRQLHEAKVEKERQWCRDESALGTSLCICAPLADDFHTWQECWEPVRKRYIE